MGPSSRGRGMREKCVLPLFTVMCVLGRLVEHRTKPSNGRLLDLLGLIEKA